LPEKAHAYGVYCQGQSKKHVAGEKGPPFSQCVNAMAKAATQARLTARQACKGMSKKHVKGVKGTPFSRCVVAAAQVKKKLNRVEPNTASPRAMPRWAPRENSYKARGRRPTYPATNGTGYEQH
jgi:hypothetical protein